MFNEHYPLNPCRHYIYNSHAVTTTGGGGGMVFFHGKGTLGCASRKVILSGNFSLGKGMLFGNFGKKKSNFGNSYVKT